MFATTKGERARAVWYPTGQPFLQLTLGTRKYCQNIFQRFILQYEMHWHRQDKFWAIFAILRKYLQLQLDTRKCLQLQLDTGKYLQLQLDTGKCLQLQLDTGKYLQLQLDTGKCLQLQLDTGKYLQLKVG